MTTLKILSDYLPYGIRVQHTGWGAVRALFGLNTNGTVSVIGAGDVTPAVLLPVLRPLALAATLLDYKDTPAIEVAKLALWVPDYLDQPEYDWLGAETGLDEDEQGNEFVYVAVHSNWQDEPHMVYLHDDWNVVTDRGQHSNQVAIIDYLRSRHFAVGLKAGEFVAKSF